MTSAPLLPGALRTQGGMTTLGVIGGGQLGRMFVHAAQALGYRTVVLDPDASSPAGAAADHHLCAPYLDAQALDRLAELCDAVTTEFENVPAEALERVARQRHVAPAASAVAVCQHRAREKALFVRSGVPCVPHAAIEAGNDVAGVGDDLFPAILKTSSLGYDGKGQRSVAHRAALAEAWRALGSVPCLLERRVALRAEFSVIVARGADGQGVHLPVQQNLHRDGILAVTQVPAADIPEAAAAQAIRFAQSIAAALGYVGVLCVEFFLLEDGQVLANEMAPRPHNSGHHSIDACDLSQFELQVRALAGLAMPAPRLHSPAVMLNLLGDLWRQPAGERPLTPPWDRVLALPGAHLHLYGKHEARPGRKMGHLTLTAPSLTEARRRAAAAAELLGLPQLEGLHDVPADLSA